MTGEIDESSALGANVVPGGVRFAVWAPKAQSVDVILLDAGSTKSRVHALSPEADGVFASLVADVYAGQRYQFRVDGGIPLPDPRSRFQPEGVHGPSMVVDPRAFTWTESGWSGIRMDGLVTYELHIGAYTPEGTYRSLIDQLPELKQLGIDAIELMPVADFPGARNWGYDGVALYAPTRAYGAPDDLRALVDAAHAVGLGVILDVVYNHLGPDGNYLGMFSDHYFTDRHETPWGQAVNVDGFHSEHVRRYLIDNAVQWIREYHVDGLRLDATDFIIDDSPEHVLTQLQREVRAVADWPIVLVAEEARNDVATLHAEEAGGRGFDAVWADDFHHQVRVLLTGAQENYYGHYAGTMSDLAATIEQGFFYQGQPSPKSGESRGTPVTNEPISGFQFCIQNHDQVGNRPFGERLHHDIDADRSAVASTLLLFAPEPVLLFMGQEFMASTPFLFFTDHNPELGAAVTEGRRKEFGGFRAFADESMRNSIPDPQAESTFLSSKLKLEERALNAGVHELYRQLLSLRKGDPVLRDGSRDRIAAVPLGAQAILVHRWFEDQHRILIANFGAETTLQRAELGLPVDVCDSDWRPLLATSEPRFAGIGYQTEVSRSSVTVPARTAVIFAVECKRF